MLALATLGQMFSYLTSLILDNLKRDSSDHAHLVDRPLKARELKFYRRAQIQIESVCPKALASGPTLCSLVFRTSSHT